MHPLLLDDPLPSWRRTTLNMMGRDTQIFYNLKNLFSDICQVPSWTRCLRSPLNEGLELLIHPLALQIFFFKNHSLNTDLLDKEKVIQSLISGAYNIFCMH